MHARTHARSVVHGISARQALEQKLHSAESLPHFLERVGLERFGERLGAKMPSAHSIGRSDSAMAAGRGTGSGSILILLLHTPRIPLRPIPLTPIHLGRSHLGRSHSPRRKPARPPAGCDRAPLGPAPRALCTVPQPIAYGEYRRHRTRRAWRARGCGTVVLPAFPLLGRPSATCCKAAQGVAMRRERGVAGEFTGVPLLGKRRDSARLGALLLHIISVKTAPTYSPSPSEPTGRPAQSEAGVRAVGPRVGRPAPRVPWVVCCVGRALSAA